MRDFLSFFWFVLVEFAREFNTHFSTMKLKHIDKLSTVAWSPIPEQKDLLIAGTVSGSMDTDFDTPSTLELYSIGDFSKGRDEPPVLLGTTSAQDRFNKIAWSQPFSDPSGNHSLGLVAGAHSNGSVSLWNPAVLLDQATSDDVGSAMVANVKNHSRPVHSLAFNPFQVCFLVLGKKGKVIGSGRERIRVFCQEITLFSLFFFFFFFFFFFESPANSTALWPLDQNRSC